MKIKIYVQPNASRSEIVGLHGDALKIKIKAPPVDGEANQELIRFLSELLKIPQKKISLKHGQTGRNKWIEIDIPVVEESHIKEKLNL